MQLELGWNAYLDPAHPKTYDPVRAMPLVAILARVIKTAILQITGEDSDQA